MANVLAELFQNTAAAIREKTGEAGTMKPAEFPEKIRAIEANGAEVELTALSVTKNGTYYPKQKMEVGGTYTLKNDYTQEELKAFYEASFQKNSDDMATYAFLQQSAAGMLGILLAYGFYGVYLSDGHIWIPEEFATQMGFASGWNFGADLTDLTSAEAPSITIGEMDICFIEGGLAPLAPLFDLISADGFSEVTVNVPETVPILEELNITQNGVYEPSEAHGYSKVTVNVQSGGDTSGEIGEKNMRVKTGSYTVDSETEEKTIEHGMGIIPDMFIFRIVGTIPVTTKPGAVLGGIFFSQKFVGANNPTIFFSSIYNTSRGVTNAGGSSAYDFTQSGGYNFIKNVTTTHFTVGGISDRHQTGVTYYWTAIANL